MHPIRPFVHVSIEHDIYLNNQNICNRVKEKKIVQWLAPFIISCLCIIIFTTRRRGFTRRRLSLFTLETNLSPCLRANYLHWHPRSDVYKQLWQVSYWTVTVSLIPDYSFIQLPTSLASLWPCSVHYRRLKMMTSDSWRVHVYMDLFRGNIFFFFFSIWAQQFNHFFICEDDFLVIMLKNNACVGHRNRCEHFHCGVGKKKTNANTESLDSSKLKVPLSLLFTPVTNRVLINVRHWRKPILNILTLWCFIGAINRPLWALTGRPVSLVAFSFPWQINQGTQVHAKPTTVALAQPAD